MWLWNVVKWWNPNEDYKQDVIPSFREETLQFPLRHQHFRRCHRCVRGAQCVKWAPAGNGVRLKPRLTHRWHWWDRGMFQIWSQRKSADQQQISLVNFRCVGMCWEVEAVEAECHTARYKYHMSHIQVEEVRWASTRLCRLRAVKAWVSNTKQMKQGKEHVRRA